MSPRDGVRPIAGASTSIGALLVAALLPKCPLCIAASLSAIGVGAAAGAALAPIARPLALAAAAGSILWVLVQQFRSVTKKRRDRVDPRADGSSCSRKAGRYRSKGDDDTCASC
jgi:hypothetical protein